MDKLSFSKEARLESLDNFKFSKNDCCNINFLKGTCFSFDENLISQDLEKILKSIRKLLKRYDIHSEILNTNLGYILEIYNYDELSSLFKKNETCPKCEQHFLIGFFITKAILTSPSKGYSLEFSLKEKRKAEYIVEKILQFDLETKISNRNKNYIVYSKQSEVIEEILALVGAQNACLEIMSGKVMRDISNKANRIANCDVANYDKIMAANEKYTNAINKLILENKFVSLSEDLKYIAELKMENPELSLTELGNIAEPILSKASVNRRMQKLLKLANDE